MLPGLAPFITQAREQAETQSWWHLQVRSTAMSQQKRVLSKEPGTCSHSSPFLMAGLCPPQALQGAVSSDH